MLGWVSAAACLYVGRHICLRILSEDEVDLKILVIPRSERDEEPAVCRPRQTADSSSRCAGFGMTKFLRGDNGCE
jgi:hypothetical protein